MRAGKSAADAETTPALNAMAAPKKNPEIRISSSRPGVFISVSNCCSILAPHSHTDRARIPRPRNLGGGCSFPTGAAFQARCTPAMPSSFAAAKPQNQTLISTSGIFGSPDGEGRQIDLEVISVEAHRHVEIKRAARRTSAP
jgi:hypothetical protein